MLFLLPAGAARAQTPASTDDFPLVGRIYSMEISPSNGGPGAAFRTETVRVLALSRQNPGWIKVAFIVLQPSQRGNSATAPIVPAPYQYAGPAWLNLHYVRKATLSQTVTESQIQGGIPSDN